MQLKPGLLTSEFLVAMVSQLVGVAVYTGHISPVDSDALAKAIVDGMSGLLMLYTAVAFIYSRFALKKEIIKQNGANITVSTDPVVTGVDGGMPLAAN
jgi:hypothetical protein